MSTSPEWVETHGGVSVQMQSSSESSVENQKMIITSSS